MHATQIFKARLPRELVEKVDAIAVRLDSSRDAIVQQALDAWVREEERRHSRALALADFQPDPPIENRKRHLLAREDDASQPINDGNALPRDNLRGGET